MKTNLSQKVFWEFGNDARGVAWTADNSVCRTFSLKLACTKNPMRAAVFAIAALCIGSIDQYVHIAESVDEYKRKCNSRFNFKIGSASIFCRVR
ncbi:hypothetical protein [Rhodopseudomonas parapalustris]